MSIPNSQLETWSHRGASTSAQSTHKSIRSVLNNAGSPLEDKDFDIFLQGSYKNYTNIYADSDVDIVVKLNSTFRRNLSKLSKSQKRKYKSNHSSATYHLNDFRSDVIRELESYYGSSSVKQGDKSIKLSHKSLQLDADVVPCLQYRKYEKYSEYPGEYVEGIYFKSQSGDKIVNFPTIHYENGCSKNDNTNQRFKETVRIFKNARSYMVDNGTIKKELAPSYFIECLVYNVPASKFVNDYQSRFLKSLKWLVSADLANLKSQNEIHDIFGSKTIHWSTKDAKKFFKRLTDLWEDW